MGSRGPLQKREGRVRGGRPGTGDAPLARLLTEDQLEPSPRWLTPTREAFVEYVDSPVANVVDPIDVPALHRLFGYYDLWARLFSKWFGLLESYAKGVVEIDEDGVPFGDPLLGVGSGGQAVPSPILMSMRTLETSIKELETRFGITPQSRARLGIDLGEAQATAAKAKRLERQERGDSL